MQKELKFRQRNECLKKRIDAVQTVGVTVDNVLHGKVMETDKVYNSLAIMEITAEVTCSVPTHHFSDANISVWKSILTLA